MNENEVNRIANAVNALRPDWPVPSLRTLINDRMANRTRRDVAIALTWVACDSATKTPARVLEAGPWWTATNAEGSGGVQIPWQEQCYICSFNEAVCSQTSNGDHEYMSRSDAETFRRMALGLGAPDDVRGGPVRPARDALAEAKRVLCSHGVPHRVCTAKHDAPQDTVA